MNASTTPPAASGGFLIFSLILAALIWGSSFTATKIVLATFDPFVVAFSRLVIAMPVLLLLRNYFGPVRYRRYWFSLIFLQVIDF